jgi:hypothetical protein
VLAISLASFTVARAALPAEALAKGGDPLPSWNDGPAKQSIITFVEKVTTPGAAVYQLGPFGTAAKKLKQIDLKP